MDIKTLIVSNLLLALTMGLLVLVYRVRRRDLGFGLWGAGSLLIASGFLALLLRAAGLPVAASVLAVNVCFALGGMLRLDGIANFIRGRGLPRPAYLLPAATVAIAAWFLFGQDSIGARTFVINCYLAGVTLTMAAIVTRAPHALPAYRVFAALNVIYALLLAGRGAHWLLGPTHGIFQASLFEDLFFLVLLVFEVMWTVCLLMMNGARLEAQSEQLHRERLAADATQLWLQDVIARSLNEIYIFDASTMRFTFVNAGACRNLGYTMDELLSLTPSDIKPRIAAAAFAHMVRPLREGTLPVLAFETVHRRKNGSEYPVEVHLQLVDSGRGKVFLAVINDITERTRTEARLRLNEARLESLLEIAEFESRSEQQLLDFALHKALALTGSAYGYLYLYREETRQFVLNSWSRGVMDACTIVAPQTLSALEQTGIWGEAVRQRRPILINDFAAADPLKKGYPAGHVPLRNFLTVPVFSGLEIVAVVGVGNREGDYDASDIVQLSLLMESVWRVVERARAEQALQESETRFRALFESMTEGVALHEIVCDSSGAAADYRLLDVNAAFEHHTGIAAPQARGALASVLYGGDRPFLDQYAAVARGGAPQTFEIFYPPLNKHFRISVVSPKTGQFATVFEDISERKIREAELRVKSSELERFIYTVSHDLRSPLVTIKSFLGFLERDMGRAEPQRIARDIGFMRTAADTMGRLLDDLLEMSRIGRVVAAAADTSFLDLATEAVTLVAGGIAERRVAVQIDPVEITLRGDRARLVEIWQNIVENAVKFMGDQPAPQIRIGAERREEAVVFFVRDNGSGFDPRYREKIFGLFERLDPAVEGTGLGLAVVKRVVELYGGSIAADSDGPGRGASISFTLPGALLQPEPVGPGDQP